MEKQSTPIAVITNIFYFLGGVTLLYAAGITAWSSLFLLAMAMLTAGSTAFHAWQTKRGQLYDEMGMYAVGAVLVGLAIAAAGASAPMAYGATGVLAIYLLLEARVISSFSTLPMLFFIALLPLGLTHGLTLGGLYLVALGIRFAGERFEDQGRIRLHDWMHGIWHMVTALIITQHAYLLLQASLATFI